MIYLIMLKLKTYLITKGMRYNMKRQATNQENICYSYDQYSKH